MSGVQRVSVSDTGMTQTCVFTLNYFHFLKLLHVLMYQFHVKRLCQCFIDFVLLRLLLLFLLCVEGLIFHTNRIFPVSIEHFADFWDLYDER
jgi:hypothetical protein